METHDTCVLGEINQAMLWEEQKYPVRAQPLI